MHIVVQPHKSACRVTLHILQLGLHLRSSISCRSAVMETPVTGNDLHIAERSIPISDIIVCAAVIALEIDAIHQICAQTVFLFVFYHFIPKKASLFQSLTQIQHFRQITSPSIVQTAKEERKVTYFIRFPTDLL